MIDGKLISEYLIERQGIEILEKENGFISFRVHKDECHISDIYIRNSSRGSALLSEMIGSLSEIATKRDCKELTGSIHLWDLGKEATLKAALKLGFKISRADQGMIFIKKEL